MRLEIIMEMGRCWVDEKQAHQWYEESRKEHCVFSVAHKTMEGREVSLTSV